MDVAFFSVFQNSYSENVLLVTSPLREWGRAGQEQFLVRRNGSKDSKKPSGKAKRCSMHASHFAMVTSNPIFFSWT